MQLRGSMEKKRASVRDRVQVGSLVGGGYPEWPVWHLPMPKPRNTQGIPAGLANIIASRFGIGAIVRTVAGQTRDASGVRPLQLSTSSVLTMPLAFPGPIHTVSIKVQGMERQDSIPDVVVWPQEAGIDALSPDYTPPAATTLPSTMAVLARAVVRSKSDYLSTTFGRFAEVVARAIKTGDELPDDPARCYPTHQTILQRRMASLALGAIDAVLEYACHGYPGGMLEVHATSDASIVDVRAYVPDTWTPRG